MKHKIELDLEKRILVLDGAMGTMVQSYALTENDYRNDVTRMVKKDLKGNTDILNLTRPNIIREIHEQYLLAGADILSTNTFGANKVSQEDYDMGDYIYDINFKGAVIAREAIDAIYINDSSKIRYVAGAMGPTTKLASMSPIVSDPGYRAVSFDQLVDAYTEQAKALIDGGVDLFLLETITDTLNVKAALYALSLLFENIGREFPIMVSGTITDASGRILSGQTVEAFLISISHIPLLSVGLNCALGAAELRPYVEVLHQQSPFFVSIHPNAGLPNQFGSYDQTPEELAGLIEEFCNKGWLNIVGGCCGTTPLHIKAIVEKVKNINPRKNKIDRIDEGYNFDNIKEIIEKWQFSNGDKATFTFQEIQKCIKMLEDKNTFLKFKSYLDKELKFFHSEQAMLLNANLYGRYQYLRSEQRFA